MRFIGWVNVFILLRQFIEVIPVRLKNTFSTPDSKRLSLMRASLNSLCELKALAEMFAELLLDCVALESLSLM